MTKHLPPTSARHVRASVSTRSAGGYRFAVVSDADAWPGRDGGPAGLLGLSEEAQIDGFDRLTENGHAIVLVCGTRDAPAVRRASALARSRSQARVAVVPVELGPLGQQAIAAVGRELVSSAVTRPAAELISWLPVAARSLLDLALVSSVAKLDLPGIGVRHHVMAYLPGRRTFVVQIAPAAAMARVTRAGRLRPESAALHRPDFQDAYSATVAVAGPRQLPDVVLQACRMAAAPVALPSAPALRDFWRDSDATEVVVVPTAVTQWAAAALPSVTVVPCRWCGEALAATTARCVFCGNVAH